MPLAEPRAAVAARPTKPVAVAWAKKVPTPTRARPTRTAARFGVTSSGRPMAATASAPQKVGRLPERPTARPAGRAVAAEGRKNKKKKPHLLITIADGT